MKKLMVVCLVVILVVSGCAKSESSYDRATTTEQSKSAMEPAPEMPTDGESQNIKYKDEASGEFTNDLDGNGTDSVNVFERKIIKTGYVYMETTDYDQTIIDLKQMIEKYNAYTAYSQNTGGGLYESDFYQRSSRFTIKVPAEFFEKMYEELETVGHVLNANEGKEDITSQFIDIESRLTTLYVQEERLLSILERSEQLEDIIELEYALQDVRYEIERYTTSIRNLEDQVRFSTLDVNVQEVYEETEIKKPVITFSDRIRDGLSNTFKEIKEGAENLIVYVIVQFPYLLFMAFLVGLGVIFYKRYAKKSKLEQARRDQAREEAKSATKDISEK